MESLGYMLPMTLLLKSVKLKSVKDFSDFFLAFLGRRAWLRIAMNMICLAETKDTQFYLVFISFGEMFFLKLVVLLLNFGNMFLRGFKEPGRYRLPSLALNKATIPKISPLLANR